MDEVTQQNAALVEEAAAAAESMQEQAQNLLQAVSLFKLSGGMESASVRRNNRQATVTKLPNRGKPTNIVISKDKDTQLISSSPRPRRAASGGGEDSWEEF